MCVRADCLNSTSRASFCCAANVSSRIGVPAYLRLAGLINSGARLYIVAALVSLLNQYATTESNARCQTRRPSTQVYLIIFDISVCAQTARLSSLHGQLVARKLANSEVQAE